MPSVSQHVVVLALHKCDTCASACFFSPWVCRPPRGHSLGAITKQQVQPGNSTGLWIFGAVQWGKLENQEHGTRFQEWNTKMVLQWAGFYVSSHYSILILLVELGKISTDSCSRSTVGSRWIRLPAPALVHTHKLSTYVVELIIKLMQVQQICTLWIS